MEKILQERSDVKFLKNLMTWFLMKTNSMCRCGFKRKFEKSTKGIFKKVEGVYMNILRTVPWKLRLNTRQI